MAIKTRIAVKLIGTNPRLTIKKQDINNGKQPRKKKYLADTVNHVDRNCNRPQHPLF